MIEIHECSSIISYPVVHTTINQIRDVNNILHYETYTTVKINLFLIKSFFFYNIKHFGIIVSLMFKQKRFKKDSVSLFYLHVSFVCGIGLT